MHISLYRKYRPRFFSEVVGQSAAVGLLRSSFLGGRMGHAYLFSGPRGCGKTTVARLLAKVVNCTVPAEGEPCGVCESCRAVASGEHLDVMEIDGASNRGIDQIRELKSHVSLAPFMSGRKVYILDEVHMLTAEAFNALLKTLEEPPASALFIFATTEPHKVPVTIRSRCQHIPFHRISTEDIAGQLQAVAGAEGFAADEAALWEIARSADGALRDALSLAEQAVALGGGALTADAVRNLSGGGGRAELEEWVPLLRTDPAEASGRLKALLERGVSPERFLDTLFTLLRDMWVFSLWDERSFAGVSLSESETAFLRREVPHWTADILRDATSAVASLFQRARWGLRIDVFSGLLMFELVSILTGEARPTGGAAKAQNPPSRPPSPPTQTAQTIKPAPPARPIAAREPAAPRPPADIPAAPVAEQAPEPAIPPAPSVSVDDSEPVPPADLPDLVKGLWANDLSLCAALIDVGISVAEGALVFDCSGASRNARMILESPRAKHLIASLLGVGADEESLSPPEAAVRERKKPERPAGANPTQLDGDMSIEQLSAYLGADLLMARTLAGDESEETEESE